MNEKAISIRVLILAHGGAECGMGHVVRSLSLASAFRVKGCIVQFISKYQEGIEAVREQGYYVHEQGGVKEIISQIHPHVIVVDTYNVTYDFFIELKQYAKVVYIDDLYAFDYPVDVIINGNITGYNMGYQQVFPKQKHLLGIDYNLIRNEFSNMPVRVVKKEVTHIMITTGASDPANMTCRLLDAVLKEESLKQYQYNIIIGAGFIHQKEILKIKENYNNIHCFINPGQMSRIMLDSDIAISAGGSTLYELAACGTPVLAFIYADNQRLVVEKMAGEYLVNLGYFESINYGEALLSLKTMIDDEIYRTKTAKVMQKLVDGKGAQRTAEEVLAIIS